MVKIDNTKISFDDKVVTDLKQLLPKGQEQFESFWDEGLVKASGAIDSPIKKNNCTIPGKFESEKKEKEKKLVYSPGALNKLSEAVKWRPELTTQLFATELFGISQSLAKSKNSLYHPVTFSRL